MTAPPDERKRWITAQAEAILAGFGASLIEGDDGRPLLIVTRWALCRSFADLDDVARWVKTATGSNA